MMKFTIQLSLVSFNFHKSYGIYFSNPYQANGRVTSSKEFWQLP